MNTKLTINLKEGILDVDGSEEFVRSIYDDFKGEVAKQLPTRPTARQPEASILPAYVAETETVTLKDNSTKSRAKRASANSEGPKKSATKYKPTFDPTLDLKGLPEFYDKMIPENAAEKILIFASFLQDNLGMLSCTADHIYTCFFTVKGRTKIPEAFEQAFRDTQSRTHFIQINSLQDISITIPGSNRLEEMKKRKAAA